MKRWPEPIDIREVSKVPYDSEAGFVNRLLIGLDNVSDIAYYLTNVVKLAFWLGLTILLYAIVAGALFPTEFIMVPREFPG